MTKDEIQKVTLGTNEALRVTADGEFIWHPEADAMIEKGDFTSSPAMRHILRALRKALAAPDLQAELVKANSQAEHFEREWYLRGDELEATNRQVEILSDALAESRREVAALKAVQEPVFCEYCGGNDDADFGLPTDHCTDCERPQPAAQPAPPECQTEAEKTAFAFGWWKALESVRQPAVPDAFGTREGEHPQYVQGWNDCRAEMLKGKTK
jgi:hypothetical protein